MIPYTQADDAQQPSAPKNTINTNSNNTELTTQLRTQNPLSDFSSYTYHLTLYICSPEAMAYFIANGTFAPGEKQNYIVAQSGGLSESDMRALTYDGRLDPTGPGYDYYIEDLTFEMAAPAGRSPTVPTKFNFKIIEPLGFTFLTKLSKATEQINLNSPMIQKTSHRPNLFQQHYVLGIRFYGYDENGKLVEYNEINPERKNTKSVRDKYANFERLFPILISKCTYKLDGKAVTYNVEAAPLSFQIGAAEKFGIFKKKSTIVASTVGEALQGKDETSGSSSSRSLTQILNDQQTDEKDTDRIEVKTRYRVEFLDDEIKNASIIDDDEYNTITAPMSSVKTTNESTVIKSSVAVTTNNLKKQIAIGEGTPILSVIDNIVSKSSYITRGLLTVNNERIETASESKDSIELVWFSINPVAVPIGVDPKTRGFVYDITFQIQKYYVPYLRSLYKKQTTRFYGVHKNYDFIFTGQNTEIINYEQEFNTLFYVVRSMSITDDNPNLEGIDPKVPINTQNAVNSSVDQSKQNRGSEINSNVKSNLNNVADLAKAKIKIHGDPDYLMQAATARSNFSSAFFKRLYGGDGFSINPYGGQIFFQIVFRTAEDYQTDGLLDVNDQIKFYSSSTKAKELGINGVIYRLVKVTNYFNRGQFTQDLEAVIVSETELGIKPKAEIQRENRTPLTQAPVSVLSQQEIQINARNDFRRVENQGRALEEQERRIKPPLYDPKEAARAREIKQAGIAPGRREGIRPTLPPGEF